MLYGLRNETQDAFNEAKALEASWADLEKEQRDVYQASSTSLAPGNGEIDDFVKEFKSMRKVYHKRVMWGEKWTSGEVAWRDD
ncbi:hypothetical protein HWV62_3809 [Athelia sp. TMB]|nr:hypothetical protein HWV62_3809 [Athelia sp. TMB]